MPTVILDRIPLPNLKLYSAISVLLVSSSVYFAVKSTSDPNWRLQSNSTLITPFSGEEFIHSDSLLRAAVDGISNLKQKHAELTEDIDVVAEETLDAAGNATRTLTAQFKDVMSFMCQEAFCIWVSFFYIL